MSDEEFSYFDLGSGLPLDNADVTITAAEARFDTQYSADAAVVALTFQPDDTGTEAVEQLYSIGKGWEPIDQGAGIAHTSGRQVKINSNSNYGKWIAAAVPLDGFIDEARSRGVEPNDLSLWVGLRFHLGTQVTKTRNPSKPDAPEVEKTLIVPTAYLGTADDEAPVKTTKKASTSKASTKAADKGDDNAGVPAVLAAKLRALANESDSFDAFLEAAMERADVVGNSAAEKFVMSSKADGCWATRND